MGLFDTLGNVKQNLSRVQSEFDTGDRNVAEYIVGTGYEGVAKPVMAATNVPIDLADRALTGMLGSTYTGAKEAVGQGVEYAMDAVGITDAAEWVDENIPSEYRRFANELIGTLGVVPVARAVGAGKGTRSEAEKGMYLGSGNVIKKGHYNPTEVEVSRLEGMVGQGIRQGLYAKGYTPQQVTNLENAYRQKRGTAEFLASGLGRVANLAFNPAARAKYAELGLTPVFDEVYKKYQKALAMPAGNERKQAVEKAVEEVSAQLQQMQHIRQQAGAVAKGKDATMPFALASADEFVPEMYFRPKDMGHDWVYKITTKAPQPREVRKSDAQYIQSHFTRAWSGDGYDPQTSKIIVKSPRSQVTGNHFRDALGNNEVVTKISNLFQGQTKVDGKVVNRSLKEFDSVEDLYKGLQKLQKRKDAPAFRIHAQDETGVWVQMSKAGTAKVEGGVNILIKVEPNGDLTGVMSDLHNFYEQKKIGGVTVKNVPMKMALPDEVLAITRPMQTNVVSISARAGEKAKGTEKRVTVDPEGRKLGKFGVEAESRRIPQAETAPIPETGKQPAAERRIQETGMLRPSKKETLRQTVPVGMNIVAAEGMLTGAPEEEN